MTGDDRAWYIRFEAPGRGPSTLCVSAVGPAAERARVIDAFRAEVRAAMEAGGCRSFVVAVHQYGPGCDHEVG